MGLWMFALPVSREVIDRPGWRAATPWSVIAHISPDPAFLDAFSDAAGAPRRIQNLDRCVVRMQAVRGHNVLADARNQRGQNPHALAAPIHEGGTGNVGPHAGKDFVLPV